MARTALDKPRFDAFRLDPFADIAIITLKAHAAAGPQDRVDSAHVLCERYERPITREEIEDVNRRGILQPIRVVKDGADLAIVAIGRRRVRMARAAQELRDLENASLPKAAHKPPITVPAVLIQGDDLSLRGAMLAENIQRQGYSPIQTAQALAEYAQLGADPKLVAASCGQKASWVKAHLALLDCSKEVRAHVEEHRLSVTAAATLSELPVAQQVLAVERLLADGKKATVAKTQKAVKKARTGKDVVEVPTRKQIHEKYAVTQQQIVPMTPLERGWMQALAWVLGETP
jgi:ParB-like chromosome segregation protein Spo0J